MSENPLLNYQVQPGTYVRLPSGGKFYDHPPTLTADGEIEVKPMNAVDELHFLNPDSLLNNESLYKVIENCVPGIPVAREILKPDMDVIMLGLRVATYGDDMEITAQCAKCNHTDKYMANLTRILASAKSIGENTQIELNGLRINVKPFTVASQQNLTETMVNIKRTSKQLEAKLKGNETDEEVINKLREEMGAMVKESSAEIFRLASDSIVSIEMPDETVVSERPFIYEWLDTLRAPDYKVIRNAVQALSEETVDRHMTFVCTQCEHENNVEVQFDPANFFVLN